MLTTRHPNTATDFEALYALDVAAFGANAFPRKLTEAIAAADQTYFTCLYLGEAMIGYGTLYPLQKDDAEKFCRGQIKEAEMRFLAPVERADDSAHFWYIPDLVVAPDYQKNSLHCGIRLFAAMLESWGQRADLQLPATVLALAFSDAGRRFAFSNQFELLAAANQMADGFDLVGRIFHSSHEVQQLVVKLKSLTQTA